MSLEPLDKLALEFVNSVVSGNYDLARGMVVPSKRSEYSEEFIASEYQEMIEYGDGAPDHIEVMNQDSMNDWASKEVNDLGWVYVAIAGQGYSEAVALIFTSYESAPAIREIEWGRP